MIKVYTLKTCDKCHALIDEIREANLKYKEIDCEANVELATIVIRKTGSTKVPMVEIGNTVLVTPTLFEIKEVLRLYD